jgi:uncharacterized protein
MGLLRPKRDPAEALAGALMDDIALFPLRSVLMPAGLLPLRIFEPRYVDLIGRCLRRDEAFGVVLIRSGQETASEVSTAEVGTSARIIDFQSMADGLLGVLCRGERRFRIHERSQQDDGLNRASVEWLPGDAPMAVQPHFRPLVEMLRQALASLANSQRLMEPHYEDAGWVSHRLAELLPLEPALLQRLLELEDPDARLRLLAPLVEGAQQDRTR